jgi:predicted lactoylglutathione lyase
LRAVSISSRPVRRIEEQAADRDFTPAHHGPPLPFKPQGNVMHNQIFVNLPVKDLDRSVAFFKQLGYSFNPRFTDENATCMILGDSCFVMLLVEPFFQGFTPKAIADAHKTTETIIAVPLDNRAAVDALVDKALAAGATAYSEPKDYGFMYQRSYQDLDGHLWEVVYMDMDAPGAPQ